ncbi:hypothetical protein HPB50_005895 [Hyalomma asiaticum]|uniref:Uncharacterized protein n=1 Tax=Hyalomma asiaticum TaxID=266040 RepID=A0ACB7TCY7_HYAAI|nr:hypothetical protein HPB50_005895 [Hyalomma asiaticum]
MDVDSPGPPPTPSTSSATGARKRSGQPSDADSEDTIIYGSASEESSYDSDFVPVTRRKAKRRLLVASSSTAFELQDESLPSAGYLQHLLISVAESPRTLRRHPQTGEASTQAKVNSKPNVASYLCGQLDAAACDMGTVYEDQMDDPHKNGTLTSGVSEDGGASCVTEAGNRDGERNVDEFNIANSIFESKEGERAVEKRLGFGAFRESTTSHKEVRMPPGNYGECRTNFEVEVDTAECVPPAVDTCGADMVDYHADGLPIIRGKSRVDANGVCPTEVENNAKGLLQERREEMKAEPATNDGVDWKGFLIGDAYDKEHKVGLPPAVFAHLARKAPE